jgi:hypothetical protein
MCLADGHHEDRTREVCNLPVRNASEEKAFKSILAFVRDQQKEGIGVSGYTFSAPDTFYGYWWDDRRGCWVEDKIILLTVDYQISIGDPTARSISQQVSALKDVISKRYRRYGSEQDEVWIVASPVSRYL